MTLSLDECLDTQRYVVVMYVKQDTAHGSEAIEYVDKRFAVSLAGSLEHVRCYVFERTNRYSEHDAVILDLDMCREHKWHKVQSVDLVDV